MFINGIPVTVNEWIGEPILRIKQWRRRGIGRLPKVRVRRVGRKPAYFFVGAGVFAPMYIVNPEGFDVLRKAIEPPDDRLTGSLCLGPPRDGASNV